MSSKNAKIKDVSIAAGQLTVRLEDGRVLGLPLTWYPSLQQASPSERRIWRLSAAGAGIHWPALDYDLSVEGLLDGRKEHPNALRYTRAARTHNLSGRKTPGALGAPSRSQADQAHSRLNPSTP